MRLAAAQELFGDIRCGLAEYAGGGGRDCVDLMALLVSSIISATLRLLRLQASRGGSILKVGRRWWL